MGVSWSSSCLSNSCNSSGFCIKSSTPWHQCSKFLQFLVVYTCSDSTFYLILFMVIVLDWEVTRRIKSSFMEYVAFSWKPLGTSNENWTHHRNHFAYCKFCLIITDFSWICCFLNDECVSDIHENPV